MTAGSLHAHKASAKNGGAMVILALLSLLGIGCYAYALCVLLLIRRDAPLLWAAAGGCFAFGLAARACLKRGRRVLCALHGLVAAVAGILLAALLLM